MLHREAVPSHALELLTALSVHPALDKFALVGGTSLALRFGHRISVDLDFFTREPFDGRMIAESLAQTHRVSTDRMGENSAAFMVDDVKVDCAIYRYAHLKPAEIIEGIRIWSVPDVIAMKLGAIVNRGAKKDFYDAQMLIEKIGLDELIVIYRQKFPGHDPAIVLRSLCYFEDAEDETDPLCLTGITWPEVKKSLVAAVKKML